MPNLKPQSHKVGDSRNWCLVCIRKKPNYCKRHSPKTTVKKIVLYNEEQLQEAISKALEEQMKEVIKSLPSKAPIPEHICEGDCVYSIGECYNQVLEEFKENLKQAGLI